jgi:hypothetical protein
LRWMWLTKPFLVAAGAIPLLERALTIEPDYATARLQRTKTRMLPNNFVRAAE